MQDARCQMQDARYRMQDAQCKRVYISAYNKCAQHLPWVPEVCRPAKRALDERRFNPPNIEAAHSRAQAEHSTGEPFYEIPSAPDLRRRSPILAPLESHLRPPEPRKTIMWLPRETAIPPDGPHSANGTSPVGSYDLQSKSRAKVPIVGSPVRYGSLCITCDAPKR